MQKNVAMSHFSIFIETGGLSSIQRPRKRGIGTEKGSGETDRERGDSRRDMDRNSFRTGSDSVSTGTRTVWGDPEKVSSRALGADSAGRPDQLVNVRGRGPLTQTSDCASAGGGVAGENQGLAS